MKSIGLRLPPSVNVTVDGTQYSVSRGTRVSVFLRRYLPAVEPECLGAVIGNRLVDLDSPLAASTTLEPVTYASKVGARIYRATLAVMLCEAAARCFPGARVQVGQALDHGYYYDVLKQPPLAPADVAAVETEMRAMVERKEAIVTLRMPRAQAIELFESMELPAKAEIVRAARREWVAVVTMGQHVDLWLEPMLPSTEGMRSFRVSPFAEGLVLGFPPPGRPDDEIRPPRPHTRLFAVYRETREWNRLLGVETVADLNRAVVRGGIGEVIRVAEALHERKIAGVADEIVRRKGTRLVLIAGPSASGKTTFAKRLRMQLLAIGVRPKELSVDDYYVDREATPRDAAGEYDFECLEAIDLPLLNEHLAALMRGEEVPTPRYSFTRGRRAAETVPMRLGAKEVLIMEGIHGLNPRLTEAVPDPQKLRLYVSALTQLCIDDHNRIFTSDARLLRRTVRDRLFRGYTAMQTMRMWPKVRGGEERHIFPFQEQADLMFNSALVYEPAVLKVFAERFFMEVAESDPAFVEASRMMRFLDLFVPVFADDVPATSIVREFIGGSAFDY